MTINALKELYSRLSSKFTVYDEVAITGTTAPYIIISSATANDGRLLNNKEKLLRIELHIWSDKQTKKEVIQIHNRTYQLLEHDYDFEQFQVIRDISSGWYHGICTYTVYFETEK